MNSQNTYYHASTEDYTVGECVSIVNYSGKNYDYVRRKAAERQIIDIFDKHRPQGYPSRSLCIYLFGKLEDGLAYIDSVKGDQKYHVYQVTSPVVHGPYPMRLVDEFMRRKGENGVSIIKEYWNPSQSWNYSEYICEEMRVLQIFSLDIAGTDKSKVLNKLLDDKDIADGLFCG